MQYKLIWSFILITTLTACTNRIEVKSEKTLIDSVSDFYDNNLYTNPDSLKTLLYESLDMVTDSLGYYKLRGLLASYYLSVGVYDSAYYHNKALISYFDRHGLADDSTNMKSKTYTNLSVLFYNLDRMDSAIIYGKEAIRSFLEAERYDFLPQLHINLADLYQFSGDFANASAEYRKGLMAADTIPGGDKFKPSIYNGLIKLYNNLENYPLADHYSMIQEVALDSMETYDQYFFCNTRANYYYFTKQYQKAIPWLYKAEKYVLKLNYPFQEAVVYSNLGEIYLLLHQEDSAKVYLDKTAKMFFLPEVVDASPGYHLNGLYAQYYLQIGDLRKAEELMTRPYAPEALVPTYVYYNDKRMEGFYEKKGDYKKAYEHRKRADLYNDSLRNVTIQNNIAEMDMRYSQDTTLLRRDVVIARQKQEVSQLQTYNVLILTCLVIVILGFIIGILYVRRKRERRYTRQMSVIAGLRMENIRNRVSPHFMFNVLNAVLPSLRQHPELAKPVDLLVQSVRDGLLTSEKMAITLEEEIRMVRNFLDLRKSIRSSVPVIDWNISDSVDTSVLVPSMIIQIPVENAVKYAFDDQRPENKIDITISSDNGFLNIIIADNGKGFDPGVYSVGNQGTGNGLKILYRTIELLNTRNQSHISFRIENLDKPEVGNHGTRITIVIPENYKYNV